LNLGQQSFVESLDDVSGEHGERFESFSGDASPGVDLMNQFRP
jgi:hypothetical protein